jgi:hypothetical protein
MRKTLALVLLAGLVAMLPTLSANAAPGGKGPKPSTGTSATLTIDQSAPYHLGDVVTFTPSTTATDRPWERLQCYQNGFQVLNESHVDYWPNALDDPGAFALGPTDLWAAGDATCVATLQMNTKQGMKALATVSFSVLG